MGLSSGARKELVPPGWILTCLGAWKQTAVAVHLHPLLNLFFLLISPARSPCCHPQPLQWAHGLTGPPLFPWRKICGPGHGNRNSGRPKAGQKHYCCLPTPAPASKETFSHGVLGPSIYFLRLLHIHAVGLRYELRFATSLLSNKHTSYASCMQRCLNLYLKPSI